MWLGPGSPDQIKELIGVVATIGDDMPAVKASQQLWGGAHVVGLPGRQQQADWQAAFVDDGIDLGAQSATRTTDGVICAPFFAPAAC